MSTNHHSDTLFIIKTIGLEYDDRVRKESRSVQTLGQSVRILVFDDKNINRKGLTSYNVPYLSIRLKSRAIFPQKKYLLLKLVELYIHSILHSIKIRPRVVWIHNIETSGLIPLLYILKKLSMIEKIIWDQHELPPSFFLSRGRRITAFLLSLCDKTVIANHERKDYIKKS